MRPHDHLLPTTPDACQQELAQILARGLLRLRGILPPVPGPENLQDSVSSGLELTPETSVTVTTAVDAV